MVFRCVLQGILRRISDLITLSSVVVLFDQNLFSFFLYNHKNMEEGTLPFD